MAWTKTRTAAVLGASAGAGCVAWKIWKNADLRVQNRPLQRGGKIVILGAGFGGMAAAQELSKLLPEDGDAEITLIDQNNFLLFTPMLTEVAGGELDPRHIVAPPRQLSRRIQFRQGTVREISLANRSVTLELNGGDQSTRTLQADHLIIALGSVPKFHGIPGVQEHSLPVKSIGDAAAIRNRVLTSFERASWESDEKVRRELLTFVIGGGGYTGVETMAAINGLARESIKNYPGIAPQEIETYIVEPGDRLLPELSADLASFAEKKLEQHGVQVILKTKVASAGENYVELESGKRIPSRTLIWAGGVAPNPLVGKLNCERGKHSAIVVDGCCRIPGHFGLWALGDCAEVPKPGGKETYAPTAQNATREGRLVARNIVAMLRGQQPKAFAFQEIGELALVGKREGVAKIYGRHFSGLLAWAMWRAIYLSKMPGMAQRARILLDWALDFVFGRTVAEFPVDRSTGARTHRAGS
jgi:NADH dehydrogenase